MNKNSLNLKIKFLRLINILILNSYIIKILIFSSILKFIDYIYNFL